MKNVLFYGNCQSNAIKQTINLPSVEYNIIDIPCWTTDMNKEKFTEIIKICDIIITQPIDDNYRNLDYLSTSYIIKNKQEHCKIIVFNSCYFNFYYFDLTYKKFNNDILHLPIDYHYNKMIECYNNNLSIEHYIINYVDNINLKTSDELDNIAENSLNELKKRDEENIKKMNGKDIFIITIHDYIKNNYKNKLLFYSMNHPTKYIFQYICEEIINILSLPNTINYDVDILGCSSQPKCILYKCIQKSVNFNINDHVPLTKNKTNINEITQLYYDTYKQIGFL